MSPTAPATPPPPFFFIRHGETDWNKEGRIQGQIDTPMNGRGRDQAAAAGRILGRLLAQRHVPAAGRDFVASPLGRTRQTMELLRGALSLPPAGYRCDDRLREISFGAWQGHTWPEIRAADPDVYAARRRDRWNTVAPGGESYAGLAERLRPWLGTIEDHAVVVSHGGVARVLMVLIGGVDTERAPTEEIAQGRVLVFERGTATWV